jgi:8-oxo-dGTP diphosphatase
MANREQPIPPGTVADQYTSDDSVRIRHGVKALVSTENDVLLVREHHADRTPFWTLPGGGIHREESDVRALKREMVEELLCECVVGDPVGWFPYAHQGLTETISVYTVYDCQLCSRPDPVSSNGVSAIQWSNWDSPPVRTLPQVRRILRTAFDG